jgi:hypothetical protein
MEINVTSECPHKGEVVRSVLCRQNWLLGSDFEWENLMCSITASFDEQGLLQIAAE